MSAVCRQHHGKYPCHRRLRPSGIGSPENKLSANPTVGIPRLPGSTDKKQVGGVRPRQPRPASRNLRGRRCARLALVLRHSHAHAHSITDVGRPSPAKVPMHGIGGVTAAHLTRLRVAACLSLQPRTLCKSVSMWPANFCARVHCQPAHELIIYVIWQVQILLNVLGRVKEENHNGVGRGIVVLDGHHVGMHRSPCAERRTASSSIRWVNPY